MRILGRQANAPIVFLFLGLIAGALVGYATLRAETSEIRIGPLNIEVQGKKPSARDELTDSQAQHIVTIMLIGGVIGLGCGFAVQRQTLSG
jgi:hypothetical protein